MICLQEDIDPNQFCEQSMVLSTVTFGKEIDKLHQMQLMVSFKMSLCMLLFMYVLYSLCKIAFNYKKRDYLTTTLQVLFGFCLLFRGCQIGSNLITKDDIETNYTLVVIFCYLADFCFQSAVIFQIFLWLDIGIMVKFQQPAHFQNQDTQKLKFNRFERKLLVALIMLAIAVLCYDLSNAINQLKACDQQFQRFMDIGLGAFMIVLEVSVAIFFVLMIKNHRSITWRSTSKETYAIIIGIVFSFIARIVSKAIHKEKTTQSIDLVISYHITSFVQFIISEFIPIALWTAFKSPDDFFNVYNDLPIQKFSIFQSKVEDSKSHRLSTKGDGDDDDDRHRDSENSRKSETEELLFSKIDDNHSI